MCTPHPHLQRIHASCYWKNLTSFPLLRRSRCLKCRVPWSFQSNRWREDSVFRHNAQLCDKKQIKKIVNLHYRDRTLSPEAIKWRQDISPSVIGGREVARVRGSWDVSGVTSGQRGAAAARLSVDIRPACSVSGNRDPDALIFFFYCYFFYSRGERLTLIQVWKQCHYIVQF